MKFLCSIIGFEMIILHTLVACCTPLAVRGLSNCRKCFMLLSDRMCEVTDSRRDNSNCRTTQFRRHLAHRGRTIGALGIISWDYVERTVINQLTTHILSQGMCEWVIFRSARGIHRDSHFSSFLRAGGPTAGGNLQPTRLGIHEGQPRVCWRSGHQTANIETQAFKMSVTSPSDHFTRDQASPDQVDPRAERRLEECMIFGRGGSGPQHQASLLEGPKFHDARENLTDSDR